MEYPNYCMIKDINDKEYEWDFYELCENEYFMVVDKQYCGESLGRKIIDKLDTSKITQTEEKEIMNEIVECEDFTDEFKDEMLTLVEEEITNKLRNEICEFLLEYLGNNL